MIGGRLLGVRGPAQGIFKQGLMTPPGVALASAPAAFDPASVFGAGTDGFYFDFVASNLHANTDGTGTVATAGDLVGYAADLSGKGRPIKATHNFMGSGTSAKPLLATFGGFQCITTDGTAQFLADADYGASTLTLNPTTAWFEIIAFANRTYPGANGGICFGGSGNYQGGTHNNVRRTSGSAGDTSAMGVDEGGTITNIGTAGPAEIVVMTLIHNGASTKWGKNALPTNTINPGSSSRLGIGLGGETFGAFADIAVFRWLAVTPAPDATTQGKLLTSFGARVGLPL